MTGRDTLLAYFGHHKCATQWMRLMVARICEAIGREQVIFNDPSDFDKDIVGALPRPGDTFLCYTNAERRFVSRLENFVGVHVVRDPRDVIVSAYFSHLYSHPLYGKLGEWRERLESVPEREGLMLELEDRVYQFRAMLNWDYQQPNVLELRMEDITVHADEAVPRILEFLGLSRHPGLDDTVVQGIVEAGAFSQLAGREPGVEDVTSHYRKGVAGDWVNHFAPEHVAYFKEHYNALLLKLGYETSADWGV
jgi:hypothetical protein